MRYGYFDEAKKEYVITRPDTPAPWVNYLGSPEYGAIVSNNAGGYSFAKSGANGRILRYIFNQFDQPGRYIYLRDNESKDYWSASWQPVGKDLDTYKSECHHGTAYTKMMADYSEIHSEVRYYVPLERSYEVWSLAVTNNSEKKRELTVTGYAEFTNNSNYEQDQVNLQYSQYITQTVFRGNRVRQMIHANLDRLEEGENIDNKNVFNRFFRPAGIRLQQHYEVDRATDTVYGIGVLGALENGFLVDREEHEGADQYYQYCTVFPVGTVMAQTWNRDLMQRFGEAVALEMEAFHVNLWLAPGLNIQRNPLRGFEIAVKEGQPAAIMSSYNLVNGVHAANSKDLCTRIARKEWGFDGVIMSDWNTTVPEDGSVAWKCAAAGNDIIMPGNAEDAESIRNAYRNGDLTEEEIRSCAGRILELISQLS